MSEELGGEPACKMWAARLQKVIVALKGRKRAKVHTSIA